MTHCVSTWTERRKNKTKDKAFKVVLQRTKGKIPRSKVPAVCTVECVYNCLKSEYESAAKFSVQVCIHPIAELRTETVFSEALHGPWIICCQLGQLLDTHTMHREDRRGRKKWFFLFLRSCQVDLHSAGEWCVMCWRAFFLLIPSTLVERIGLRDE